MNQTPKIMCPFLNTGIIILCTHNSGYIPVFIILLKSFPKIGIKYALPVIKYSFIKLQVHYAKVNDYIAVL
jgi:hypothetical protein